VPSNKYSYIFFCKTEPMWETRVRDLKLQSRVLYPVGYAKLHTFSTPEDMLTQTD